MKRVSILIILEKYKYIIKGNNKDRFYTLVYYYNYSL